MRIEILRRESSEAGPVTGATVGGLRLPEGVELAAVERCLAIIEARDPLTLPADQALLFRAPVIALALGDASEVLGVAWQIRTPEGMLVDVRVQPGARRRGVGAALLQAVTPSEGVLLAGCDAAHPRVRRFLLHQGFSLTGVVFHQRWDGALRDVPAAFATARLTEASEPSMVISLLHDASGDTWPRVHVSAEEVRWGHARIAWRGGEPAGAMLAHRERDAWSLDALAVLPAHRRLGVGRGLISALMRMAAEQELGVCLRVAQQEEELLAWTQALGFWTYRTWALYSR